MTDYSLYLSFKDDIIPMIVCLIASVLLFLIVFLCFHRTIIRGMGGLHFIFCHFICLKNLSLNRDKIVERVQHDDGQYPEL